MNNLLLQTEPIAKAFEYDIFLGLLVIMVSGVLIFLVRDRNYYRSLITKERVEHDKIVNEMIRKFEEKVSDLYNTRHDELMEHGKVLIDLHTKFTETQAETNRLLKSFEKGLEKLHSKVS